MDNRILLTILIVLFLVIAEVSAEFLVQKSVNDKKRGFHFALSIGLYILIPIALFTLFETANNLTVANTIWQVANIILVALIGYFAFEDNLSFVQVIGIVLAIVSAFLMMFGEQPNKKK
jgi:multidrug transporter EmrE-like cation transporter